MNYQYPKSEDKYYLVKVLLNNGVLLSLYVDNIAYRTSAGNLTHIAYTKATNVKYTNSGYYAWVNAADISALDVTELKR